MNARVLLNLLMCASYAADFSELERLHTSHIADFIHCAAYFDHPLTLALCFSMKDLFTNPGWFGF